jgi:hypothetical protein
MKHILYIYICWYYISVISSWLQYRPSYRYFHCRSYYQWLAQGPHCGVFVVLILMIMNRWQYNLSWPQHIQNVPDFGRMFLILKYTDITQNTYIQSWTVTEMWSSCCSMYSTCSADALLVHCAFPFLNVERVVATALRTVVPSCKNAQSAMLNQYFNIAGYSYAM